MWQNYFELNGNRYYTGTVLIVKLGMTEEEASFVGYNPDKEKYVYKTYGYPHERTHHTYSKYFYKDLVSVTDKIDKRVSPPVVKQLPDRCIDGLPLGWLWYVVLMAIVTIFNGNIALWVIISYVFFGWRKKKIEKEGTYIEW